MVGSVLFKEEKRKESALSFSSMWHTEGRTPRRQGIQSSDTLTWTSNLQKNGREACLLFKPHFLSYCTVKLK
jgi:hypothetical protein